MTRIRLGLTDQERRELDQARRVRNCCIAISILILICGWIAAN